MSVHRYSSVAELVAHLGPVDLKLYNQIGRDNYIQLMEMWACVDNDEFEEWYDNTDPEVAEHILELSSEADQIFRMYDSNKFLH